MTVNNSTVNEANQYLTTIEAPARAAGKSAGDKIKEEITELLATEKYKDKGLRVGSFISAQSSATNVFLSIEGNIDNLDEQGRDQLGQEIQAIVTGVTAKPSTNVSFSVYTPPPTTADKAENSATAPAKISYNIAVGRSTTPRPPALG